MAAILCIGDAAGVQSFHRSTQYLLMVIGIIIVVWSITIWVQLSKRNGYTLPTLNSENSPSYWGFCSLVCLTIVGIIYSFNLLFTFGPAGANAYIAVKSIILDISIILAVGFGLVALMTAAGDLEPCGEGEYTKVRRSSADGESDADSWASSFVPFSLIGFAPSRSSRHQYQAPTGGLDEEMAVHSDGVGDSSNGSICSHNSVRSENISTLMRANIANGFSNPSTPQDASEPSTPSSNQSISRQAPRLLEEDPVQEVEHEELVDIDETSVSTYSTVFVPVGAFYDAASPPVAI